MQSTSVATPPAVGKIRWAGYVLMGLAGLFLLMDGVMKVMQAPVAVEATVALGFAASVLPVLGVLQLACLAIYLFPRTAVLGAVLQTGYLGGAIAIHLRADTGLFTYIFPVLIGLMIWGGVYFREPRLWPLLPLRKAG